MKFSFLNKVYSLFFLLFSIFIGASTIEINQRLNTNIDSDANTRIVTTSIPESNLQDDIESLSMIIDITNETIHYDIEFKNNDFNGTQVSSYFFHMDLDAEYLGLEFWVIEKFDSSDEIVEDKKASNTTSYTQVQRFDDYNHIITSGLECSLGVFYQKDGEEHGATIEPIHLRLDYFWRIITIEDDMTTLSYNDEKTVAQIGFEYENDDSIVSLQQINLKSHSDTDLNQSIYGEGDSSVLPQGNNVRTLLLMSEYHYYDLYLEFVFNNPQNGSYIYESDIDGVDFTSGVIQSGGIDFVSFIILLFIVLIIILMIIIIILIIRQMKKRKELERQQDQAYYDENYEDGMN